MSNTSNASLVLNTVSGVPNTLKTSCTWSNIDLRMLLGDMYDKYDRFNLCLNTVAQSYTIFNPSGPNDCQCLIRINGLSWLNNSYNISANGNNNTANTIIGSFQFISTLAVTTLAPTQYFYGANMATFGKSQDIVNITIDYIKVIDLTTPTPNSSFPNMSFVFDIFGVDDFKTNSTDKRLKI